MSHKQHEINKLMDTIHEVSTRCGSCVYWMTRQCPREKQHHVSYKEIACDRFRMGPLSKEFIEKKK